MKRIFLLIFSLGALTLSAQDNESVKKSVLKNFRTITQSIISGDADKLASVTRFPILRSYPEKHITNAEELKAMFPILFDDSIRSALRGYSPSDWERVGWRGYMLNDGYYFWADEDGMLSSVNYESEALRNMRSQLREEERQDLDEAPGWETEICLVATDSSLFVRIENYDGAKRLHLFFRDTVVMPRHYVFNGSVQIEGSCGNKYYQFPCAEDMLFTVWTSSLGCEDASERNHVITLPDYMYLPDSFRNRHIELQRAFWRDVKNWWQR